MAQDHGGGAPSQNNQRLKRRVSVTLGVWVKTQAQGWAVKLDRIFVILLFRN